MKKLVLALTAFIGTMGAMAQTAFTPGNLVVYRVGSGTGSLVGTGNPIFIDEYTTAGVLVQSVAMPTAASGSNKPMLASGTATSEGLMTLSVDGHYLIVPAYGAVPSNTVSLSGSSGSTIPRVVGRIDGNGTIDASTALTDFATGSNPRSAMSTDGTNIWVAGGAGGVRYATLGSTTSNQISTTVTNLRQLNIFGSQIYASSSSGAFRLTSVGTGEPTTSGQTIVNLPGFPTTGSPYGFFFADLNPGVAGLDAVYVADDGANQIQKYTFDGTTWTAAGTATATGVRGLTGSVNSGTVTLYGTTGTSTAGGGGSIYTISDATGTGSLTGTVTAIATAGANTTFRGIAFTPTVAPCFSPTITAVTSNAPICDNKALNLNVSVSGSPTFTYSWSGTGSFNATTASTATVTGATTSIYSVTVTNSCGTATSTVSVMVNPTYSVSNPVTINQGSSYVINTHTYTTAGTYTDNMQTTLGCDSIVVTQLTVNPMAAALNFDGSDDYIAVPTSGSIPAGATPYTLEAWIKPTGAAYSAGIIGYGDFGTTNSVNAFRIDANGGLVNYWWGADLTVDPVGGNFNLYDGNWHHVAATYDGTTRTIYIDGVAYGSDLPGVNTVTNTSNVAIGLTAPMYSEFFTGSMDEVRIWNRALCPGELQNNMTGELKANAQTGLVVYYKLNQGYANADNSSVTMASDSSGNGLNGTLTNFGLTGTISTWIAPGAVTTGNLAAAFSNNLNAVFTQTNVAGCYGDNTGAANAAASGYTPYSYMWSTGDATASISNLVAGDYTCTISNGCGTITQTVTITQPTQLMASSTAGTILCNGGVTTVTVTETGGTSPYTGDGVMSSVAAGTYTYTVTDNNSCTATTTITISEPTQLMASSTAGTILCNGGVTTVTVTETGGTSPYTGDGVMNSVAAGTYSYTVTDDNGCTATTTITVSEPTALMASSTAGTILCNGDVTTVTVTETGGTSPYTGDGAMSNVAAGTYSYTVTDDNGCTSTTTITVNEPTQLMVSSTAGNILCNGDVTSVTLTATGGTPAYTLSGDATNNLTAGTYTYLVTDANGCTATTTVSISEPNAITTNQSFTVCAGGSISVGTNTYTAAGTYTDVLTSAAGCDSTVTTTLAVNNAIDNTVSTVGAAITSNETNANATYQWVDCNNSNAPIAGATSQSFTATTNGSYAAVVTVGSCSVTSACTTISNIGIEGFTATTSINVYPNPFSNQLTIVSNTKAKAMLFDMLGNILNSYDLQNGEQTIAVGELAPGVYYLQVDAKKVKIIKQ